MGASSKRHQKHHTWRLASDNTKHYMVSLIGGTPEGYLIGSRAHRGKPHSEGSVPTQQLIYCGKASSHR